MFVCLFVCELRSAPRTRYHIQRSLTTGHHSLNPRSWQPAQIQGKILAACPDPRPILGSMPRSKADSWQPAQIQDKILAACPDSRPILGSLSKFKAKSKHPAKIQSKILTVYPDPRPSPGTQPASKETLPFGLNPMVLDLDKCRTGHPRVEIGTAPQLSL